MDQLLPNNHYFVPAPDLCPWWSPTMGTRYLCVWSDALIAAVPQLRGKVGRGRKWVGEGPAPTPGRFFFSQQDVRDAFVQRSEWRYFCTLKAAFVQLGFVDSETARDVEQYLQIEERALKGGFKPRSNRPRLLKPTTPAALALPDEFAETLRAVTPVDRRQGANYISARRLHGLFRSARQFTDWIEHRETQRVRRRPDLPRLNAVRTRTKQPNPTGGRPAFDFLLTAEQVRFMSDCDKSPSSALVLQALDILAALQALQAGATVADALSCAGAFPVRESYTVRELTALLGEVDGYPSTERGWRKRLECERRNKDESGRFRLTEDEIMIVRRIVLTEEAERLRE